MVLRTNELSHIHQGLNAGSLGQVVRVAQHQNELELLESGFPSGDQQLAPVVAFQLRGGPVTVAVPAITRELEDGSGTSRTGLPLDLAFALTVHSAAGLTLNSAIFHGDSIWPDGGLVYTALSRVRSMDRVQIVGGIDFGLVYSRPVCVDFMLAQKNASVSRPASGSGSGSGPASAGSEEPHQEENQEEEKVPEPMPKKQKKGQGAKQEHVPNAEQLSPEQPPNLPRAVVIQITSLVCMLPDQPAIPP